MSNNPGILVVEDDIDLLKMVELYLKRWKFAADAFSDPVEALTLKKTVTTTLLS